VLPGVVDAVGQQYDDLALDRKFGRLLLIGALTFKACIVFYDLLFGSLQPCRRQGQGVTNRRN